MSNNVSLQADVGGIPSNSLAVLGSLKPLLVALSANNVLPCCKWRLSALAFIRMAASQLKFQNC
jgi:hypothetical protein